MSADNYYTVKYNEDDGKWYLLHGFMSSLEDDIPALWNGHPGFSTWEEALASYDAQKNWSEYGLIQEQAPLASIVTPEQWRTHLVRTIERCQSHLEWMGQSDA